MMGANSLDRSMSGQIAGQHRTGLCPVASNKLPYSLSFIIPALNEEEVLESVTREIVDTLEPILDTYELIFVDDGSTDKTGEIMDRLVRELPNARVIHNNPNLGLGAAYWRGVGQAKYDYVMMLNGDGGLLSLPPILQAIGTADVVVPYVSNLRELKTPFRYFVSRAYTVLMNILSGRRLHYYNGLPVHRRVLLNQIKLGSDGFGYSAEIIIKLLRAGCTFVEVGVPGIEKKNKSFAFRFKNVASVANTIVKLIVESTRTSHIERYAEGRVGGARGSR